MAKLAINGGQPVRRRPFHGWPIVTEEEINAVTKVVESGDWGPSYPPLTERTEQFLASFAEYHNVDYALPVTNGSTAIEVSLRNAGIGPGDEVITPASTWVATNLAPVVVGADPVFADVSPDTYCIDPDKIEEAITPRTRAIILVHIGGYVCDMDRIMAIAQKHDLVVIEDCAQAHGSKYRGKVVGGIGHFGCFSFQISKLMTAGEGGAVITNDENLGEYVFGVCGLVGKQTERITAGRRSIGWNYRMTQFQVAILLIQLGRLEQQRQKRVENAEYLKKRLLEIAGIQPLNQSLEQNYYSYFFKYDSTYFKDVPKQTFKEALRAEGIEHLGTSPTAQYPVYRSPYFYSPRRDYSKVYCPEAEKAFDEEGMGFLGTGVLLGEKEDMDDIADAIIKVRENIDELL